MSTAGKSWTEQGHANGLVHRSAHCGTACRNWRRSPDPGPYSRVTDGPSKPAPLRRIYPDRFLPPHRTSTFRRISPWRGTYCGCCTKKDADDAISMGFDKFAAVLGAGSDDMGRLLHGRDKPRHGWLGPPPTADQECHRLFPGEARTAAANQLGTVHYTIGNAFHALREEQEAKRAFEAALEDPALGRLPETRGADPQKILVQVTGCSVSKKRPSDHYREALRLAPDLAESP